MTGVILAALLLCVAAALYFLLDPSVYPWMPKCPVHTLTGYDCPGCGSQRAIHALLHGELADAWRYNALLVAMIPYIILYTAASFRRLKSPRLYARLNSPAMIAIISALIVGWTIYRNL